MALVGTLRTFGAPAPLTSALGLFLPLKNSSMAQVIPYMHKAISIVVALGIITCLASCERKGTKVPALPPQADQWVSAIVVDSGAKVSYIGKTKELLVTESTEVRNLSGITKIAVGDEISGLRIGAIKCMFFQEDAFQGKEQYMWRGKWGCQAGRSKDELLVAVSSSGKKQVDYIYATPVQIP